jgi:hypothetical protein
MSDTVESLIEYCRENNRVCPQLKMLRLAEHIQWAEKHNVLELVAGFLGSLREEDWYHVGE